MPSWMAAAMMVATATATAAPQPSPQPITFTRDVAPILYAHCIECHRPGGDGPFSLTTWDDARRHATQIAAVTRAGVMPPWKPDAEGGPFVGERRLRVADIERLGDWASTGAQEGPRSALPPLPGVPASGAWQLGTPDLVLPLARYLLPADGADSFRNFVVAVPGTGTLWVRGLEFRPRSAGVHHANIRIDPTPASRRLDDADPDGGYEGLILHSADFPSGQFLGWTPGQVAPLAPPDFAWPVRGGTDLVVQLHMRSTGKPEAVQPLIGLYLSDRPGTRTPSIVRLGRQNLDIPAGAADYVASDSFVLPVDAQLLAVQPHAHYRAQDVRVWATLPDRTRRALLHVPSWDFAWQDQYRYASPFWLPAGTVVEMEYHFDNSDGNPKNPVHPPQRVGWGWRSADEMADVWVQLLTRSDADRAVMERDARRKMALEDARGAEVLAARSPGQTAVHNDAALTYLELGQPADALRHFTAVTRLDPASAVAWYNEGIALEAMRQPGEALARYRQAVALNPRYSAAFNNIGNLLAGQGQTALAVAEYRRAIEAAPDNAEACNNLGALLLAGEPAEAVSLLQTAVRLRDAFPEAHFNLGRGLLQQGQAAAAAEQFRDALAARPDWPPALVSLSWLLAAHADASVRRPAEAMALAGQAVLLTRHGDAGALDALAAAQAAAGRFDEATATATDAARVADAGGDATHAAQIRERLAGYRERRPFVVD